MNIKEKIENKIKQSFLVEYLQIDNESHKHRNLPNAETHFRMIIVSDDFIKQLPVKRHQSVYKMLCTEMNLIHALSLHTYTKNEWQQQQTLPTSPQCMHKKEADSLL